MQRAHELTKSLALATLDTGSAMAQTGDGRIGVLAPGPVGHPFDAKGLRAGPGVDAVAIPLNWNDDHPVSVLAARRSGETAAMARPSGPLGDVIGDKLLTVLDDDSLVVDVVRRILGLATGPAPATITLLHDGLWLDRMVETCLASPLGEPPPLPALMALHPDAAEAPPSPEALRHLRLQSRSDWHSYHAHACDHGIRWAGVSPSLASWFDPGSLARWLFGLLPEPAVMLSELGEMVPETSHRLISKVLECSLSS